jgi:hypothetical protein
VGEERDQLRAKLDAALGQLSKSEEVRTYIIEYV